MKDGDLVEFKQPDGDDLVLVGGMDKSGFNLGAWPAGTLAVVLGPHPFISRWSEPATMILIDGLRGWVWNDEIRPAAGATAPA
jgi:hypothetical protein